VSALLSEEASRHTLCMSCGNTHLPAWQVLPAWIYVSPPQDALEPDSQAFRQAGLRDPFPFAITHHQLVFG